MLFDSYVIHPEWHCSPTEITREYPSIYQSSVRKYPNIDKWFRPFYCLYCNPADVVWLCGNC